MELSLELIDHPVEFDGDLGYSPGQPGRVVRFSLLASSVSAALQLRLPLGASDFEKLLQHVETQVPPAGQDWAQELRVSFSKFEAVHFHEFLWSPI